jgi:(p)ppGpp synthase/HD superfamily hydrolase
VESAGTPPEVVAAALLHDVVEDTDLEVSDIGARFGPHVAELVAAMTEDRSITGYAKRKLEHRGRIAAAGREASLIFVADKLSNARRMLRGQKKPAKRKIAHYASTLEMMREKYPDLPLLDDLERELDTVRAAVQRAAA